MIHHQTVGLGLFVVFLYLFLYSIGEESDTDREQLKDTIVMLTIVVTLVEILAVYLYFRIPALWAGFLFEPDVFLFYFEVQFGIVVANQQVDTNFIDASRFGHLLPAFSALVIALPVSILYNQTGILEVLPLGYLLSFVALLIVFTDAKGP